MLDDAILTHPCLVIALRKESLETYTEQNKYPAIVGFSLSAGMSEFKIAQIPSCRAVKQNF